MQLDSFTILVAGCAVLIMLGLILGFMWVRDRATTALLWWSLPFLLGGAALVFYTAPAWDTDVVAISFGNALRMLALGCLWQGLRVFQGRRPLLWPLLLVCVGWMMLCLVPAFVGSMAARIVVVSLLNTVLCALSAHELWRNRGETLASRWPTIVVFASFALLMFVRSALVPIAPFPVGARPLDSTWLAVFMWVVFGHAILGAVLFIAMIKERREAEQRNFALSDPLTGLLNRRAFADFAGRLERRRAVASGPMALLVLDLDHFKTINDRFGHEVGDRMLKAFAEVAESSVRPTDQLFRMGGEEFCFVLQETGLSEAIAVGERIRRTFEVAAIDTSIGPAMATVSIGIAASLQPIAADVLLAAADAAVYEAKSRGRNRLVVAEPAALRRSPGQQAMPAARLSA